MEPVPVDRFRHNAKALDGFQAYCRDCANDARRGSSYDDVAKVKRWRERNIVAFQQRRREEALARHGLTWDDYLRMVEDQGNRCKICEQPPGPDSSGGRLHVDHDHGTGVVRGLLCSRCNRALGIFGDDPDLIRAALAYLL